MKLTFGIIVLNGDFFLRQVLETIYPFAHAICIAEGPVSFHFKNGITQSTDDTLSIIRSFPDPGHKIKLVSGTYTEKDQQCRSWFNLVPSDTDYVICNDADEVHTSENILKLIRFLEAVEPTSVGFKSDSFYGGFERVIGGFERDHSFKRVLKYYPGCVYRTHRQPTLATEMPGRIEREDKYDISGKDISGNQLYNDTGITMWHGSYISPKGVFEKINYYENAVIAPGKCIPDYFKEVFLKWVNFPEDRMHIEDKYNGVQEFIPEARGESRTIPFPGQHPEVIRRYMPELKMKFNEQLKLYI
jgi:hypothetical protein